MIGQTLSHYKILEEISRGGMGIVYRALDIKLNRDVALKVLPPELVSDRERKERFVREAQAAAALKHPNIAVVHEIDEIDGTTFIAMELIEGGKLGDMIAKGPISVSQALSWATEIVDGLSRAHEKGIVHRDLKPGNLMITEDGHIKIIDFGLAKLTEPRARDDSDADTAFRAKTEAGTVMGTISYMSPEQARGETVDHRSDIFSFGIILYEMLTGELPFKGSDQLSVWNAITEKDPPPMRAVPADLDRIVRRALAKRAAERFQTSADLLAELTVQKRQSDSDITVERAATSPPTSNKMMLALVAIAFVGIIAVAALFLNRVPDQGGLRIGATRQLTFEPGLELHPTLSPDGTLVAYSAGPPFQRRLYVRQIDGERTIPLTEDFPGSHRWPQWSPDGTRILFQSGGSIYVVPSLGGTPRVVVSGDVTDRAGSAVWSPDGERFAYARANRIYIQSVVGNEVSEVGAVSVPSNRRQLHSLRWSPDGKWLAFVEANITFIFGAVIGNVAPTVLWIISTSGGEPTPVTDRDAMRMSPVWMPDSRRLLFVSNQGGGRDVYSVAVEPATGGTGIPIRLTTGLNAHTIDLSPDGKTLALSEFVPRANVWSVPITDDAVTSAAVEQVTSGSEFIEGVVVSPDGQWLAFDSDRSGTQEIYKIPMGGGVPQKLTSGPGDKFLWSAGGDQLTYHAYVGDEPDIYLVASDGSSIQQVTNHPAHERQPGISPDGNHVVFTSFEAGEAQLVVMSKDSETGAWTSRRQLASTGGAAQWSPDGRRVLFRSGQALYVIPAEGGEPEKLMESDELSLATGIWSPDGQSIYYRAYEGNNTTTFWSIPAAGGTPRLLARLDDPKHQTRGAIQFGTDGKKLYFSILEQESDIALAELVPTP